MYGPVNRTLYLMQKDSETRIELDAESYERLIESSRSNVVGHHMSDPVVKIS